MPQNPPVCATLTVSVTHSDPEIRIVSVEAGFVGDSLSRSRKQFPPFALSLSRSAYACMFAVVLWQSMCRCTFNKLFLAQSYSAYAHQEGV